MSKPTKTLAPELIAWLEDFRADRRLSLPRLVAAMAAPFSWEVLHRALAGRPVWNLNHRYIVQWIAKRSAIEHKEVQRAEDFGSIGVPSKNGK